MIGWRAVVSVKLKRINKVRKWLADGSVRTHYYHRPTGRKLKGVFGSPEFMASYAEAESSLLNRAQNTLAGLIAQYTASSDFTELRPSTKAEYRRMLKTVEDEWGTMPLAAVSDPKARGAFLGWRDQIAKKHGLREAENRLTRLARVLAWGYDRSLLLVNRLDKWERRYKSDRSDRIWTPAHVGAFAAVAEPEMQLALSLALWTGQRQGDLLSLKWTTYREGAFTFRQRKTGKQMFVPLVPEAQKLLDGIRARGVVSTHVLCSPRGRPWDEGNFRRRFIETRERAGIRGLTFHDLRGTAITVLAEAGCTVPEIAAFTGHGLKYVAAILEKYLPITKGQALNAAAKLANHLRTESANRLQTVSASFANAALDDNTNA
jgi:integrase